MKKSWKCLWLFLWHIYGLSSVCLGWNLEISLHPFQPSHPSLLISNFLPSSSVQFSHSDVSDSLRPQGVPHARPPCPLPIPGVYPNSCSSSWWCHPTISSSPSPPAFSFSQHQGLCKWVSSLYQVAKVLEFQLQHQSFQWTLRTDLL